MSVYFDQFGENHQLEAGSVRRERKGVFALCLAKGHVLLSWPRWAPDLPEFPGGGIDPGETKAQALKREVFEEASVMMPDIEPSEEFTQNIQYYCSAVNEFWDYEQTYWLFDNPILEECFFEGQNEPEDALKAQWVPLESLKTMNIHASHKLACEELL